jgi:hypothetical protein
MNLNQMSNQQLKEELKATNQDILKGKLGRWGKEWQKSILLEMQKRHINL